MSEGPKISLAELDDEAWSALGTAVRGLEEAWQTAAEPDLAPFVPPPDDPLREPVLAELVKVDQEYRWASGSEKHLEAYLEEWPELARDRDRVSELLEAECVTRAVLGSAPTTEELRSRFPGIWERIDLGVIQRQATEGNSGDSILNSVPSVGR